MSAYVMFLVDEIVSPERLREYQQKARPTVEHAGGRIVVAYGRQRIVEGEPLQGVVMVEFPTYEAAEKWYDSRSYQEAAALRREGVRCRVVIVEGR